MSRTGTVDDVGEGPGSGPLEGPPLPHAGGGRGHQRRARVPREAGNLTFHVGLLVPSGRPRMVEPARLPRTAVVVEGSPSATSSPSTTTSPQAGCSTPDRPSPFTLRVNAFHAEFETGSVQWRRPPVRHRHDRQATPGISHPATARCPRHRRTVNVMGHGYAAGDRHRRQRRHRLLGPIPFLPQDGNFSSVGVIMPWTPPAAAGVRGVLPTAAPTSSGGAQFPDALNPELFLNTCSTAIPPRRPASRATCTCWTRLA